MVRRILPHTVYCIIEVDRQSPTLQCRWLQAFKFWFLKYSASQLFSATAHAFVPMTEDGFLEMGRRLHRNGPYSSGSKVKGKTKIENFISVYGPVRSTPRCDGQDLERPAYQSKLLIDTVMDTSSESIGVVLTRGMNGTSPLTPVACRFFFVISTAASSSCLVSYLPLKILNTVIWSTVFLVFSSPSVHRLDWFSKL